jgi:hypothetical protein
MLKFSQNKTKKKDVAQRKYISVWKC